MRSAACTSARLRAVIIAQACSSARGPAVAVDPLHPIATEALWPMSGKGTPGGATPESASCSSEAYQRISYGRPSSFHPLSGSRIAITFPLELRDGPIKTSFDPWMVVNARRLNATTIAGVTGRVSESGFLQKGSD